MPMFYRCPVCGKEVPPGMLGNVPDGWVTLHEHLPRYGYKGAADVCSWECAAAHAMKMADKPAGFRWPWQRKEPRP